MVHIDRTPTYNILLNFVSLLLAIGGPHNIEILILEARIEIYRQKTNWLDGGKTRHKTAYHLHIDTM